MAISNKPYIGSRDFFPEDMNFRNWMFKVQQGVCRSYCYQEYGAPLLEPLDLYRMKSSEEIVNEQLYRFVDRGEREIAIRPEMTPTLARMISSRAKETPFPARWFSIANFMRYERPGRGRLREFYQLNVDLMGSSGPQADAEILMLAVDILRAYGADTSHFMLRFSDKRLLDSFLKEIPEEKRRNVSRLLDKREKIGEEEFQNLLEAEIGDASLIQKVHSYLAISPDSLLSLADSGVVPSDVVAEISALIQILKDQGYGDYLNFDPAIVRGFDYYTGMLFEVFDRDPENRRSIFGGGRYDKLIGQFMKMEVPAVGFGLGDVTLENFLKTHGLVPDHLSKRQGIFITMFSDDMKQEVLSLASELRKVNLEVETALESTKKFGKQLELADKKNRRAALIFGPEEMESGRIRIKDLESGAQIDVDRADISAKLKEMFLP